MSTFNVITVSCLLMLFSNRVLLHQEENVPRVAVIGGGIGGTASAYFLAQLFGHGKIHIDLYEYNEIGGRLAVANIGGKNYEMGGSIIHPRNKYMTSFVRKFDLKFKDSVSESRMGLWDGWNFVFEESAWDIITKLKLLWHYGVGPLKLRSYVDDMLDNFDHIYTLQNKGETYQTVTDLLKAMDPEFASYLHVKTDIAFKDLGFSDSMINEIVSATLRVNYGQDTSVHQFVGSVSVAGSTGNLLSVNGGNFQVPKKLLEASGAQIIHDRVLKISPSLSGQLNVQRESSSSTEDMTDLLRTYDIVILAAPIQSNAEKAIDLSAFDPMAVAGPFHHTVSTVLQGHLNHSFFGYRSLDSTPDEILVTQKGPFFNSVSRIYPVDEVDNEKKSDVWKVFSSSSLTDQQLNLLFMNYSRNSIQVRDWLAYPHYGNLPKCDKFYISHNFYYLNAIEWAASAMEMSLVGAKNVALLAHKNYFNRSSRFSRDIHSLHSSPKDEL